MAEKTCDSCRCNAVCDHDRFGFENCGNYIPSSRLLAEEKERERLIDLIMSAPKLPFYATDSEIVKLLYDTAHLSYERQVDYLMAHGVFRAPCNIGDEVFFVLEDDEEPDGVFVDGANKVTEVGFKGFWVSAYATPGDDMGDFTPWEDVGKEAFFNLADAEKKLEERIKGNEGLHSGRHNRQPEI